MIKTLNWRIDEGAIQAIKLPQFQSQKQESQTATVFLYGGQTLTIPESEVAGVVADWEEWLRLQEIPEEGDDDDTTYIDLTGEEIKQ